MLCNCSNYSNSCYLYDVKKQIVGTGAAINTHKQAETTFCFSVQHYLTSALPKPRVSRHRSSHIKMMTRQRKHKLEVLFAEQLLEEVAEKVFTSLLPSILEFLDTSTLIQKREVCRQWHDLCIGIILSRPRLIRVRRYRDDMSFTTCQFMELVGYYDADYLDLDY
jgi:hypothetical protein